MKRLFLLLLALLLVVALVPSAIAEESYVNDTTIAPLDPGECPPIGVPWLIQDNSHDDIIASESAQKSYHINVLQEEVQPYQSWQMAPIHPDYVHYPEQRMDQIPKTKTANLGESYVSLNGDEWTDMIPLIENANVCLKAFTTVPPSDGYDFIAKYGLYGTGDGEFNLPSGIAVDAAGNLYVNDAGNNCIQQFTSTGTFIAKWGSNGTGDGQFDIPWGVAVHPKLGDIYITDQINNRVQVFDSSGNFIREWGGYGRPYFWTDANGKFYAPRGITIDSSGYVYVVDSWNDRVQKFTSDGTFITKWGSRGTGNGGFNNPLGIVVDAAGNVYVADDQNHRIQQFTSTGTFITKWGVLGTGNEQFNRPFGIGIDSDGFIYVSEWGNHRIQKFDSDGIFITTWGSYGTGDGQFDCPTGVVVDAMGYVYITDFNNHRIQKFRPTTLTPLFTPGETVEVQNTLGVGLFVRDAPAGEEIDGRFDGARGVIIGGPQAAEYQGVTYTWWEIRWADGVTGWSAQGEPGGDYWLRKVTIEPHENPVAAFTVSRNEGTAPLTVRFTDTSTGSPTSWHWDFGDGTTRTERNPVHVYNEPGTYDVTLTVRRGMESHKTTRPGYIVVEESNLGLNLDLEYQNTVRLDQIDSVDVTIRITGSTGLPKPSTITIIRGGRDPVTVHGDEYTYSFIPDRAGIYRVGVRAISDGDHITQIKYINIQVLDDLSFVKQRAYDLKDAANREIDQGVRIAAEPAADVGKKTFNLFIFNVVQITNVLDTFFPTLSGIIGSEHLSNLGKDADKYDAFFKVWLKSGVNNIASQAIDIGIIYTGTDQYLIDYAGRGIENIEYIHTYRNQLDQNTDAFITYIEVHPDQFRDREKLFSLIRMYSSPIVNVVENHKVVDVNFLGRSYSYSYLEARTLYDTIDNIGQWMKYGIIIAITIGAVIAILSGIGAVAVASVFPAAKVIVPAISAADVGVSLMVVMLLIANVPLIADDVVDNHQTGILGIQGALAGSSSQFVSLSVDDITPGRPAAVKSSGDVFIISPSGKVETILLGGGQYTPMRSGPYTAYSYHHTQGLFSSIEEQILHAEDPKITLNATYTIDGDTASLSIITGNQENQVIDEIVLTTIITDNTGNLVDLHDESFSLDPHASIQYLYEIDTPAVDQYYIVETTASRDHVTLLDSATFIVEREGGYTQDHAMILSADCPDIIPYGDEIEINLTIQSFRDALPVTIEVPEYEYTQTTMISGEEFVKVTLPSGEPDEYLTLIQLLASDGTMYDVSMVSFTVQADGTGFLAIETDDVFFAADTNIQSPLVFTDAGLMDLEGDVTVLMRTPEKEVLDTTVSGGAGTYQFSFNPTVQGTYIATADAQKDGYYIYGDRATFISGAMSPLEMVVQPVNDTLHVLVTANGMPVHANVTMSTNDTEISTKALSGIATFEKTDNYQLTATYPFFTPAEINHMYPYADLNLTQNRTLPGYPLLFNASGSSDTDGWIAEYLWDFGDGTLENTTTTGYIHHVFSSAGIYTVNLTVIDDDGLISSVAETVTVVVRQVPDLSLSEESILLNETGSVIIQATDLDEITWIRFVIEFDPDKLEAVVAIGADMPLESSSIGDGVIVLESRGADSFSGSADLASVTFRGLKVGDTMLNISAVCMDIDGHQIEPITSGNTMSVRDEQPSPPPVANFTATPTNGTTPLTVQFMDQSTNDPNSWIWEYSSGGNWSQFSTSQHPPHQFTVSGTHSIRLTVTNDGGTDTETKTDYITVIDPTPTITLPLAAGWNLVSIPYADADFTLPSPNPIQVIYGYNSTIRSYLITSLDQMQPGQAYWVASTAVTEITVNGHDASPITSDLTAGWNLLGGTDQVVPFSSIATDPAGTWAMPFVYGYNTGTRAYGQTTSFQPGHGYWGAVTADCTITIPGV
jgi:PKD repeat protein/sugar lactone lactonase YvrE